MDCSSLARAPCTSETCFLAFAAMLFISRRLPLAAHCLIGTAYSATIGPPFLLGAFLPGFLADLLGALAIQASFWFYLISLLCSTWTQNRYYYRWYRAMCQAKNFAR